jgi:hypothetical protein
MATPIVTIEFGISERPVKELVRRLNPTNITTIRQMGLFCAFVPDETSHGQPGVSHLAFFEEITDILFQHGQIKYQAVVEASVAVRDSFFFEERFIESCEDFAVFFRNPPANAPRPGKM